MDFPYDGARRAFLTCALSVTICFGLLKQVKTAVESGADLAAPKSEAGRPFRAFRAVLLEQEADPGVALGYVHGRGGSRPLHEHRYDAQYALAPFLLKENVPADYVLLDFGDAESLRGYCRAQGLTLLAQENGAGLALRRKP